MEDFVSFDLAKKLKAKGFDYNTDWYYDLKGGITWGIPQGTSVLDECDYTPRPTISQVLKWLREEKSTDLVVEPVFVHDNILGKMREYTCKIFTPALHKPEHLSCYEEWEVAALDGIEYALDNFI